MKSLLILALFCFSGPLRSISADDLDAATILRRAAKAQRGADLARDVTSVELALYLKFRDPEKGRMEVEVERKFQLPDRLWTRITDTALSGTVQQIGFDGKRGWNYDEQTDQTVLLQGPDFSQDLREIQNDLKTMRKLVEFFFLENLRPRLSGLERLPDQSSASGDLRSLVLRARGELDVRAGGPARITLWIEPDSYRLLGVRLVPDDQPESSEQFCFWHHRPTPQGVMVPGSVKIYRDDQPRPAQELALETIEGEQGEWLNMILFNQMIDEQVFQPPGD